MKVIILLVAILGMASAVMFGPCALGCFKTDYCEFCNGPGKVPCATKYICKSDCDCSRKAPAVGSTSVTQETREGKKFKCKLEQSCGPSECRPKLGCTKDHVCRIVKKCNQF
eukprot:TRINITY_DN738_c0_g1_i4.p1 TRINITY_DN738_c0_g1~~TRINITY_DN738_c0_g1_i4.p1  ORF type:complete len:112 (+),score=24.22 TRINITY_DN738_c0_g1_i4:43-378(+)